MTRLLRAVRDLGQLGGPLVVARLLVALSPVLFAGCLAAAGDAPGWTRVALVLLGLGSAVGPRAELPAVTTLFALWAWWAGVDDTRTWWVVPAALCLLLLHTGAALCASYPNAARLPRATTVRWARRALVVGGATVTAWLVGRGFAALDAAGDALLTVLAMALVAAAVVGARFVSLGHDRDQDHPTG